MFLERWRPGSAEESKESDKKQTVEDLGRLLKEKYPHYRSMSDKEAGRHIRKKFAPAYDDFEDTEELEAPGSIYESGSPQERKE
jgi:hypothetical protein